MATVGRHQSRSANRLPESEREISPWKLSSTTPAASV
jgi:hypothetical protein